jgi:hypothetical protein
MADRTHLIQVARELKKRLNGHAFHTMKRGDVTQLIREVSGEETTRLKNQMSSELERALLEQGVRCFPSLDPAVTGAGDNVRLFHAGSLTGHIVDMLLYPSAETDRELAEAITKFKGRWNWNVTGQSDGVTENATAGQRPVAAEA